MGEVWDVLVHCDVLPSGECAILSGGSAQILSPYLFIPFRHTSDALSAADLFQSHTIFTLILRRGGAEASGGGEGSVSRFVVADLMGMPSVDAPSSSWGKSLAALDAVVLALGRRGPDARVPYRDSVLTRVLRPALEGAAAGTAAGARPEEAENADSSGGGDYMPPFISILITATPSSGSAKETLASLRFGRSASLIGDIISRGGGTGIRADGSAGTAEVESSSAAAWSTERRTTAEGVGARRPGMEGGGGVATACPPPSQTRPAEMKPTKGDGVGGVIVRRGSGTGISADGSAGTTEVAAPSAAAWSTDRRTMAEGGGARPGAEGGGGVATARPPPSQTRPSKMKPTKGDGVSCTAATHAAHFNGSSAVSEAVIPLEATKMTASVGDEALRDLQAARELLQGSRTDVQPQDQRMDVDLRDLRTARELLQGGDPDRAKEMLMKWGHSTVEIKTAAKDGVGNATGNDVGDWDSTTGSVRSVSKKMETDLAKARQELSTVSSLLRSAAGRMEADLSAVREQFSKGRSAGTTGTGNDAPPLDSSAAYAKNEPLSLAAQQIEQDLDAARKELMEVVVADGLVGGSVNKDRWEVGTAPTQAAGRMEVGLSAVGEQFSKGRSAGTTGTGDDAPPLDSSAANTENEPLSFSSQHIEQDLEAARRRLMEVVVADGLVGGSVNKDRWAVGTAPIQHDLLLEPVEPVGDGLSETQTLMPKQGSSKSIGLPVMPSSIAGAAAANNTPSLTMKDMKYTAMEREIVALRKENEALRLVDQRRETELRCARRDAQVLALRSSDAETRLKRFESSRDGGNNEDDVSDFVSPSTLLGRPTGEVTRFGLDGENGSLDGESDSTRGDDELPQEDGSNVRVCLRLRPMSKLEMSRRSRSCIEVNDASKTFTVDSHLDGEYDFCYDQVFDTTASQAAIYADAGHPVASDLLSGINCAIMVCGLSSSGRTHTLMGTLPNGLNNDIESGESRQGDTKPDEMSGIGPRLIHDIFERMEGFPATTEFLVSCSFVAIYLEKIYDLLQPEMKKTLFVREAAGGVHIEGATKALCFNRSDVFALLRRGTACLSIMSTRMNMEESQMHSIVIVKVKQRNIRTGSTMHSQVKNSRGSSGISEIDP